MSEGGELGWGQNMIRIMDLRELWGGGKGK
jgi:hypothetical protein